MAHNTLEILGKELSVIEGVVEQVDTSIIWIKRDDGREVSVNMENGSDSFRIGHQVKMVTTDLNNTPTMLKAVNKDTGYVISTIDVERPIPNMLMTGFYMIMNINFMMIFLAFIPLINFIGGLLLGALALNLSTVIRYTLKNVGIGFAVFCAAFIIGALVKMPLLAMMAPSFGLLIGYGLIGQQAIQDGNELAKLVDAKLMPQT